MSGAGLRGKTKASRCGEMWYEEKMCLPPVYRKAAKCVSLSRSLVEGDMEIMGHMEGSPNGISVGKTCTGSQRSPESWGWYGLVLG